jgi:hypothetical protein
VGFTIPDRSAQIAADLDWLEEVDRQQLRAILARMAEMTDLLRGSSPAPPTSCSPTCTSPTPR